MYTNPLFHPSPSLSLNLAHVFENEHARAVNKLSFHPKEPNILLSGSQDSTMKIFVCDHHCYYNTHHLQMYVFIVCAHCTQVVYIAVLLYMDLACVHVYIVVMQDYVMLIYVSLLLCYRTVPASAFYELIGHYKSVSMNMEEGKLEKSGLMEAFLCSM